MANYCILLALLFVGGFASPSPQNDGPGFNKDMSIFFDHTVANASSPNDTPSTFSVGGNIPTEGEYPWMVAITNGMIYRTLLCGGSIIGTKHVLTAAHCIAAVASGSSLSPSLRVTVGTNSWNSGGQTYELEKYVINERYNPNSIKNDIGILITSKIFSTSALVKPIPLEESSVAADVPARVSGWGRTSAGGVISSNLMQLMTKTIDSSVCVTEIADKGASLNIPVPHVDPTVELCTYTGVNKGICTGDDGSPLVRNSDNKQIGVVSWGLPCARGAPDVYVRVSAFYAWINSITSAAT